MMEALIPRESGVVPAPRKYPNELRERAVRLVAEAMAQDGGLSLNGAVLRVGPRVGVVPDTLRGWVKQHRVDAGLSPGTTTGDAAKIRELERELKELRRANEILLAASSFFARELDFEQLWTKRLDEDRFEVCCVPFFAYDLALGDVVRADADTGYVIQSVETRSGNGVARVAVKRAEEAEAVHSGIHDLLQRLHYLHEWFAPGYVAINLDAGRSHDDLFEGLATFGDVIEVERILP